MAKRTRHIEVFSISFLDVLTCALGGVLLLLIYSLEQVKDVTDVSESMRQQLRDFEAAYGELKARFDGTQAELGQFQAAVDNLKATVAGDKVELEKLGSVQAALDRFRALYAGEQKQMEALLAQFNGTKNRLGQYIKAYDTLSARFLGSQQELATAKKGLGELQAILAANQKELGDAKSSLGRLQALIKEERESLAKYKQGYNNQKTEMDELKIKLAKATTQLEEQKRKLLAYDQGINGIIGLSGKLENVVFVFDTSNSLIQVSGDPNTTDYRRFNQSRELLKGWLNQLKCRKIALIDFDHEVTPWPVGYQMEEATPEKRAYASSLVDNFVAKGKTNTRLALERALKYEGVDTIVLFTDGEPTDNTGNADPAEMQVILDWLRKEAATKEFTINTIAIGERYFDQKYGRFLQQMAEEHGGIFLGR